MDELGNILHTRGWMVQTAKRLRQRETTAEKLLWDRLRRKKLHGLKFYRQVPIDRFVVDFYCPRQKLVVELDGKIHDQEDQRKHDEWREHLICEREITVLRFRNEKVLQDLDGVCARILQECPIPMRGPKSKRNALSKKKQ